MKRLLLMLLFCVPMATRAQIQISGLYDFELRKGGKESSMETNGLPNENLQLGVHQLQIFIDASVGHDISFFGKISNNIGRGWALKDIEVQLAYVTFGRLFGMDVNVSAGRIVTPFGTYPKRQLSTSNPHIGHPLFFHYLYNVSSSQGYLDSSTAILARSTYGGRLGTMYTGGYYSGAEVFGSAFDGLVEYDVAAMNAPLSSPSADANLDRNIALHGRVALHPAVWGTVGASVSSGSFLEPGLPNAKLDSLDSRERFKQQTIGVDLNLNYLYYELNAEYIANRWRSPYIVLDYSVSPPYVSRFLPGEHIDLNSRELLVDVKIDAPFYAGLYVAGRYNIVRFGTIINPDKRSSSYGKEITWENNVTRYAVTLGFKADRMVLLKASYEWTDVEWDVLRGQKHPPLQAKPDLGFAGLQVSVTF